MGKGDERKGGMTIALASSSSSPRVLLCVFTKIARTISALEHNFPCLSAKSDPTRGNLAGLAQQELVI